MQGYHVPCLPPGTRAHVAISNFRRENRERCVSYFTLARIDAAPCNRTQAELAGVRLAPKADKQAGIALSPLCATSGLPIDILAARPVNAFHANGRSP